MYLRQAGGGRGGGMGGEGGRGCSTLAGEDEGARGGGGEVYGGVDGGVGGHEGVRRLRVPHLTGGQTVVKYFGQSL